VKVVLFVLGTVVLGVRSYKQSLGRIRPSKIPASLSRLDVAFSYIPTTKKRGYGRRKDGTGVCSMEKHILSPPVFQYNALLIAIKRIDRP